MNSQPLAQETRKKTRTEIEAEIAETKLALSADLAALGEKFSPAHLKAEAHDLAHVIKQAASDSIRRGTEQAVDSLREVKQHAVERVSDSFYDVSVRARIAANVAADYVARNAAPLGLLGVGLGWLAMTVSQRRRQQGSLYLPRQSGSKLGRSNGARRAAPSRAAPLALGALALAAGVGLTLWLSAAPREPNGRARSAR